jgi:putative transcriptional regulator
MIVQEMTIQEELGKRVGVSRQAINAIVREKYGPSLPLAFKLADVFGLSIEEVFIRDKGGER